MKVINKTYTKHRCDCVNNNELDECLGILNGVMNACCGHNGYTNPYVQFLDGSTVHGDDALIIQHVLKTNSASNLTVFESIKNIKLKNLRQREVK